MSKLDELDKSFEKEFEKLDGNKQWNDFRNEYGPVGIIEVDDDSLQSLIARLIIEARLEEREALKKVVKDKKEMYEPAYEPEDRAIVSFASDLLSTLNNEK